MLGKHAVLNFTLLKQVILDITSNLYTNLLNYLKDTVEHLILAGLIYILICIALYLSIQVWEIIKFNQEPKFSKRILFVIAHPDDECMFFGPSILNFTNKEGCLVYILCLSTGRNYGMGSIRKNELIKSCTVLGIPRTNIFIHNHTLLPDSMDVRWPTEIISSIILKYIESLGISTLITFDRYGVSHHRNHCSIYYAVANLIIDNVIPKGCNIYVLDTINVVRKYWLMLDIPLSFIFAKFRFMCGLEGRNIIHKAMKQHSSQLKWFRRLYMYFSRYMLINTLQQINLVDVELDLDIAE